MYPKQKESYIRATSTQLCAKSRLRDLLPDLLALSWLRVSQMISTVLGCSRPPPPFFHVVHVEPLNMVRLFFTPSPSKLLNSMYDIHL